MNLVSICIPTYNGEKYLHESLKSIVSQSHRNIEIVVVDDCSTDNCLSIINEYQATDERIKLFKNTSNLGLVGNWNKCISVASGDFIKLHFQDDLMMEDTIEKMVNYATSEGVDIVLTDREYFFEQKIDFFHEEKLSRLSDYFNQNAVIKPTFFADLLTKIGTDINFMGEPILGLVRKEIFEKYGVYDDTFFQIGDFEFWIRLGLNQEIGFMPEKLHRFRIHSESQGAKNSREKEINPTHVDRIHLASKMLTDKSYKKFREIVGVEFVELSLRRYVNTYTKSYGRKLLSKFIDDSYFQYLDPKRSLWSRVLSGFSSKPG